MEKIRIGKRLKWINRIRIGKGKEYDVNTGELIFEGEYLNGERLK